MKKLKSKTYPFLASLCMTCALLGSAILMTGCGSVKEYTDKAIAAVTEERPVTAEEAQEIAPQIRQQAKEEIARIEEKKEREIAEAHEKGVEVIQDGTNTVPVEDYVNRKYAPTLEALRRAETISVSEIMETVTVPELREDIEDKGKNIVDAVPYGEFLALGIPLVASLANGWFKKRALKSVVKANTRFLREQGKDSEPAKKLLTLQKEEQEADGARETVRRILKAVGRAA